MVRALLALLSVVILAVALTAALAVPAFAAPKRAAAKKKPVVTETVSGATSSVSSPSASTVIEVAGKSRTSWKDRVSFGFYNEMNGASEGSRGPDFTAYNYGMIDYSFPEARFVSVRPAFSFLSSDNQAPKGRNQKPTSTGPQVRLEDFIISAGDVELATLGSVKMAGELRVYAPTSEISQEQGMIARLAPKLVATTPLSRKLELAAIVEPEYAFHSQTGYVTDEKRVRGNRELGYWNQLELRYRHNRFFGAALAAGHEQFWHREVPLYRVAAERTEHVTLETGLTFNAGPVFAVAGVSQRHDVARPKRALALFDSRETELFIRNIWKF